MSLKPDQDLPEVKSKDTPQGTMDLRRRYKIPPMSKAIRLNCLECVCGSSSEVRLCAITTCPLWPYRFGRQPRPDALKVPEFDSSGNLIGYHEYAGFPHFSKRKSK